MRALRCALLIINYDCCSCTVSRIKSATKIFCTCSPVITTVDYSSVFTICQCLNVSQHDICHFFFRLVGVNSQTSYSNDGNSHHTFKQFFCFHTFRKIIKLNIADYSAFTICTDFI